MRRLAPLAASLAVAGCLVTPPAILQEQPSAARATVLGTLWPPPDEPTFVVADQAIAISREGEPVGETETDRLGRFEVTFKKLGRYSFTFAANGHTATTDQTVGELYATYRIDLVTRPF